MMRRIVYAIGFFLGLTTCGFSQDITQKDGGKLEVYKVAFLTNRLKLSIDEAQKFWPIYNKYKDEIRQVRRTDRNLDEIAFEERVVKIRKRYKSEFTHALPEERVNQFFKVDKEFNNVVRKELQERELKQMRQQNKRPLSP
ncbi:MAG: hypothetical protein ABIN89_14360 [Chitinophagaceae bacterium]